MNVRRAPNTADLLSKRDARIVGLTRRALPVWAPASQRLRLDRLDNVDRALEEQLRPFRARFSPHAQVAIAVGSRGIDRVGETVRALAAILNEWGASPFIVPAMGSHGGATARGQLEVLAEFGITEQLMGCAIRSGMNTTPIAQFRDGAIWIDRLASLADHVIPVNRIKQHTDFSGAYQSGLVKMVVIGLGKQRGALQWHRGGFAQLASDLPRVFARICAHISIPFGIALIEDGAGSLARLEAIAGEEILTREPVLLQVSSSYAARLPGDLIDALIVDYIGKDVSGIGMDTHVVNRYYSQTAIESTPLVRRIIVRGLTRATKGNAAGIGLADYVLDRVVRALDRTKTDVNCLTSGTPEGARIPMRLANDRDALTAALATSGAVPGQERIVRITSTRRIGDFMASKQVLSDLAENDAVVQRGALASIKFDKRGILVPNEVPTWPALS
jgi:hypothetical protein